MKKYIFFLLLVVPSLVFGQFGIKGGVNFAKVGKADDINSSNTSGFHAGLFLAPPSKSLLSSRTEILFSRQGYDYKNATTTGEVDMDHIQLGQLLSVNLTKYISLLFGAQTAYLISANVDSSNTTTNGSTSSDNQLLDLYNRVDYGYAVGVEVHPIAGLLVGARYNVSLAKVYKDLQAQQRPSFTSEDAKNNVIQLSVGWRLGTKAMKKSKEKNPQD